MTKASKLVAQLETQASQMEARLRKKDERLKTLSGHIQELKAQLRKVEAQRDWLAERLNFICHSDTDCVLGCPDVMNGNCSKVTRSQWIEASKDATSYVNKL